MNTKKYEKQGICLAESGNLEKAIEMFDKAIACIPTLASAHNNRAQALRLLQRNEGCISQKHSTLIYLTLFSMQRL